MSITQFTMVSHMISIQGWPTQLIKN